MPYKRVGKCVINKRTGKNKGCSTSVAKAKKHMKALYAATANEGFTFLELVDLALLRSNLD